MKLSEAWKLIESITNDKITKVQIARALDTSRQNIGERMKNDSILKTNEVEKLELFFNVKLVNYNPSIISKVKETVIDNFTLTDAQKFEKDFQKFKKKNYPDSMPENNSYILTDSDCINIEYIGISPSCGAGTIVIDEPEITPIKLSNSLITHILKCSHPENLKVFKAQGDSMETLIEDGDLLLVDIGRTDIYNAGIYVFSVDSEWRVKRFRLRLDKVLEIISDNPKYDIELIMPDNNINLKVRGKVIKNLSRGL